MAHSLLTIGSVAMAVTALAPTASAAPLRLIELPTCAAPTPPPAVTGARSSGATTVSFAVPATARIRLARGIPVAASTNTGCAPRSTDTFVVGARLATAAEAAATVAAFRTGDWRTPGVWHQR